MWQDISMYAQVRMRGINPQRQPQNHHFQLSHKVRSLYSLQSQSHLQNTSLADKTYQEQRLNKFRLVCWIFCINLQDHTLLASEDHIGRKQKIHSTSCRGNRRLSGFSFLAKEDAAKLCSFPNGKSNRYFLSQPRQKRLLTIIQILLYRHV